MTRSSWGEVLSTVREARREEGSAAGKPVTEEVVDDVPIYADRRLATPSAEGAVSRWTSYATTIAPVR